MISHAVGFGFSSLYPSAFSEDLGLGRKARDGGVGMVGYLSGGQGVVGGTAVLHYKEHFGIKHMHGD
jgi:hypothetical protein